MKDMDKYVKEKGAEFAEIVKILVTEFFPKDDVKGGEKIIHNFIRTIVEECKPKVSKAFIGKITARIYCDRKSVKAIKTNVREAFEEAGVEVK